MSEVPLLGTSHSLSLKKRFLPDAAMISQNRPPPLHTFFPLLCTCFPAYVQFPQELEAPAIRLVHHSTANLDELVAHLADLHSKQQTISPDWKPLTLPVLRRWIAKVGHLMGACTAA